MSNHPKHSHARAFNEALTMAAEAQRAVAASAAVCAEVRACRLRRAALRTRRLQAREAAASLLHANGAYVALQAEVDSFARELHRAGTSHDEALTVIKGRVRFTLYDASFAEHEAEAVVQHVGRWVADSYHELRSA